MKLLICGSREGVPFAWADHIISDLICSMEPGDVLLNGDCPTGVDAWALETARKLDVEVKLFPADWERYGKSAGPRRNREMVAEADMVAAIWDGKSRGTRSAVEAAERAGKLEFNCIYQGPVVATLIQK